MKLPRYLDGCRLARDDLDRIGFIQLIYNTSLIQIANQQYDRLYLADIVSRVKYSFCTFLPRHDCLKAMTPKSIFNVCFDLSKLLIDVELYADNAVAD